MKNGFTLVEIIIVVVIVAILAAVAIPKINAAMNTEPRYNVSVYSNGKIVKSYMATNYNQSEGACTIWTKDGIKIRLQGTIIVEPIDKY